MKNLFLLTFVALTFIFSQAQTTQADTWAIKWNKKVLLESSKEDETANTRQIERSSLDKNCFLEISYKESDPAKEKDWKRSIIFFDESDKELLRKDSTREVKIKANELKKLFAGNPKIKIYTIAIPTDPELAARVRVRRVHLCTLELQ